LAEISRQLYERISMDKSVDDATRQQLLDLYDILWKAFDNVIYAKVEVM